MTDLLQCDGKKFRAKISEELCEGYISVENGTVFLCQNERNGLDCKDKKGYRYSWHVFTGSEEDLCKVGVYSFEILSGEMFKSKEYLPTEIVSDALFKYEKCEISFSEMVNMLNKHIDKQVHIKYD